MTSAILAVVPLSKEVRSYLRSGVAITSATQCVDELVLNALDANATCVAVRVDLSCGRIQVVDNGDGMTKDMLQIIADRYMTSKCHNLDDLKKLSHFGYRGEALASIRTVCAILEIETRYKTSSKSHTRIFKNGAPIPIIENSNHKCRQSAGTTVTVHDLFSKLPVRKKSVNASLELEKVRQRMEAIALIHPWVSFSLRNDLTSHKLMQTHKSSSVLGAFTHLFGGAKAVNLCDIQANSGDFQIHGYISKESHYNKNLQFIFVNGRLVLKSKLHKLINYHLAKSLIGKRSPGESLSFLKSASDVQKSPPKQTEKHGVFVINVTCPLTDYDITFDPTKTLVEFKDWPEITACLRTAVEKFLVKENLIIKIDNKESQEEDDPESQEDTEEREEEISISAKEYGEGISTWHTTNTVHSHNVTRPKPAPTQGEKRTSEEGMETEESDKCDPSEKNVINLLSPSPPGQILSKACKSMEDSKMDVCSEISDSKDHPAPENQETPSVSQMLKRCYDSSQEQEDTERLERDHTFITLSEQGDITPASFVGWTPLARGAGSSQDTDAQSKTQTTTPLFNIRQKLIAEKSVSQSPKSSLQKFRRSRNRVEKPAVERISKIPNQEDILKGFNKIRAKVKARQTECQNQQEYSRAEQTLKNENKSNMNDKEMCDVGKSSNNQSSENCHSSKLIEKQKHCEETKSSASGSCDMMTSQNTLYQSSVSDVMQGPTPSTSSGLTGIGTLQSSTDFHTQGPTPSTSSGLTGMRRLQSSTDFHTQGPTPSTSSALTGIGRLQGATDFCMQGPTPSTSSALTGIGMLQGSTDFHTQGPTPSTSSALTGMGSLQGATDFHTQGPTPSPSSGLTGIGRLQGATDFCMQGPTPSTSSGLTGMGRLQGATDFSSQQKHQSQTMSYAFKRPGTISMEPLSSKLSRLSGTRASLKSQERVKVKSNLPGSGEPHQTHKIFLTSESLLQTPLSLGMGGKQNQNLLTSETHTSDKTTANTDNRVSTHIPPEAELGKDEKESLNVNIHTRGKYEDLEILKTTTRSLPQQDIGISANKTDFDKGGSGSYDTRKISCITNIGVESSVDIQRENEGDEKKNENDVDRTVVIRSSNPGERAEIAVTQDVSLASRTSEPRDVIEMLNRDTREALNTSEPRDTTVSCTVERRGVPSKLSSPGKSLEEYRTEQFNKPYNFPTIPTTHWHMKRKSVPFAEEVEKRFMIHYPSATETSEGMGAENMTVRKEGCDKAQKSDEKNNPNRKELIGSEESSQSSEHFQSSEYPLQTDTGMDKMVSSPNRGVKENLRAQSSDAQCKHSEQLINSSSSSEDILISSEDNFFKPDMSDFMDPRSSMGRKMMVCGDYDMEIEPITDYLSDSQLFVACSDCHKSDSDEQTRGTQNIDPAQTNYVLESQGFNVMPSFMQSQGFKQSSTETESQGFNEQNCDIVSPDDTTPSTQEEKTSSGMSLNKDVIVDKDTSRRKDMYESMNAKPVVTISTSSEDATSTETTEISDISPSEMEEENVCSKSRISQTTCESEDTTTPMPYSKDSESKPPQHCQTDYADKEKSNNDSTQDQSEGNKLVSKQDVSDGTVFVGASWICKIDPVTGRKIFINRITGVSSYVKPGESTVLPNTESPAAHNQDNTFTMLTGTCHMHGLLSSSASQFLLEARRSKHAPSISPSMPSTLTLPLLSPTSIDQLRSMVGDFVDGDPADRLVKWRNKPFADLSIEENKRNRGNDVVPSTSHLRRAINPYRFSKDMLQDIEVLGQVDNKFIACLMKRVDQPSSITATDSKSGELLVIIDQHAAHERVRLEQLTQDISEECEDGSVKILSSKVKPPLELTLAPEDFRIVKNYKQYFNNLGIEVTENEQSREKVWVHTVPACFVEKEATEVKRKRSSVIADSVQMLIKNTVETLQTTHGARSGLPREIHTVLCSQACHGAIKFGDPLSAEECVKLLDSLSQCKLPFQCAHGRPSVMPIVDMVKLTKDCPTKEVHKPRLWRLRRRMEQEKGSE